MTVIARRIKAIPERSAIEAWRLIVDLAASEDTDARQELLDVEGIAASIITDEAAKDSPIVFHGNGPRTRFYCLYGEDAVGDDEADESRLSHCPTDGDWKASLPCLADDLEWVRSALAKKSARITAREVGSAVEDTTSEENARESRVATINEGAFLRR